MGKFLAQGRVDDAVSALRALGLGRIDAQLIRWLMLKYAGLTSTEAAEITSSGVSEFAIKYFYMPIDERYGYYNPFGDHWYQKSHRTDWAIQTLYTQLARMSQKEKRLYQEPVRANDEKGVRFVFTARPEYQAELVSLLPSHGTVKIPPTELAVWRFRTEEVTDETDLHALGVNLITELNIDLEEYLALFAPDQDLIDALFS